MSVLFETVGLLILANTFIMFAWYAHLKKLNIRVRYRLFVSSRLT